MANMKQHGRGVMSAQPVRTSDPLAALATVSTRLKIDELNHPDLGLVDQFSFKASVPGKWPSWTDLDMAFCKQGNPDNKGEVIKALHDLCSKAELMLDQPACQKAVGSEKVAHHRAQMIAVRKKLALFEDALSPPNHLPLICTLEGVDKRLADVDPNSPEVGILDGFAFHAGKPGLFATWTDLDMAVSRAGTAANRGAVITAIRDLISKSSMMFDRPACQRTLGSAGIEKYRAMVVAISERLASLEDALSPPNPQPLLCMLEEVNRKLENVSPEAPDPTALDSFVFCPGKPGLFTVWTDLDVTPGTTGNPDNRGAVIMAVHDLMAKFDLLMDRPACQKALGMTAVQKYRSIRISVGEKLDLLKNVISPTQPSASQIFSVPVAALSPPISASPSQTHPHQPPLDQELIDAVRGKIGGHIPIWRPTLFSRVAWLHAGATAGSSMMVAILLSFVFSSLVKVIPIVGLMAIMGSFVRRQWRVAARAQQCILAEDLYKNAATNDDIVRIFPLLTTEAQSQFLAGLDEKFQKNIATRYPGLKNVISGTSRTTFH